MGFLEHGVWHESGVDTPTSGGGFVRVGSRFRRWVTADGAGGFPAEPGRYRLYVSLACPWAHRTLLLRRLKGLADAIAVVVVDPVMSNQGWAFGGGGARDVVNGFRYLHQAYTRTDPDYTGRVTVPVLWDDRTGVIVNNESADIVRMFNSAFNAYAGVATDYYPAARRGEIDALNAMVYERVNDGVYRAGFAGSQRAYEAAVTGLFGALDEIEARLAHSRYLAGDVPTEADWRLFPTLVRFDAVYYVHFKCNLRRISDYPRLSNYLRDLYQMPGVAETVNLDHIKRHYYLSHRHLNPSGIVPLGPAVDFGAPHDRGTRASAPHAGAPA